jgi:hypothetical protein
MTNYLLLALPAASSYKLITSFGGCVHKKSSRNWIIFHSAAFNL